MPFNLYLIRTVDGTPRPIRWREFPDSEREHVTKTIADFEAGLMPMERTLTVHGISERSWRWADIRDMWIEEA